MQRNLNLADDALPHITFLGDSTIDNRIWVDGLVKSYFYTRLGINRDEPTVRIEKSHRILCKPPLSVIENVMDMLPNYIAHDYTNDGFTTDDCLNGQFRDKVFGKGTFSLFPHTRFCPLKEGKDSIKKSQHIIVSVGGNDFREFLLQVRNLRNSPPSFIRELFTYTMNRLKENYIAILQQIRQLNNNAQIILMTQYYPSASQNNYKIYEFMSEIGEILEIDAPNHNPMTVIHEIMKMTYADIFKQIPQDNIVVADITSSLNLYDDKNHVNQIEPSDVGGKKIAQMLKHLMTHNQIDAGCAYHFYPEFFTVDEQAHQTHVEKTSLVEWVPAHPYDLKEGYSLQEEKIFREYGANKYSCHDLLNQLQNEINKYDISSTMYTSALRVLNEAQHIALAIEKDKANSACGTKKWKMSIVLTINLLKNRHQPQAIRLLEDNAAHRTIGTANHWKAFKGAMIALAGVAMTALSVLSLPISGSMGALGVFAGGLLCTSGVNTFYQNRQRSLSKELSELTKEANKQMLH